MPDVVGLPSDRDIAGLRGPRHTVDWARPYAWLIEPERSASGCVEDVATVFITNKSCPFRCLMCDLWKNTTPERVPVGAVAGQVRWALERLPGADSVKLYNSGNFFDDQAIPPADRRDIAGQVSSFRSVIVECHPKLVDRRCVEFATSIDPAVQVAMGLETVDPNVLPRLNKRMTLEDFTRATTFLLNRNISVRSFVLLRTPFQSEAEGIDWAMRSVEYAFSIGVECCAVIPTRAGNGAMDQLQANGHFSPPTLASMEAVLEYGLGLGRGRVLMDLWDVEQFSSCTACGAQRTARLSTMNLTQCVSPSVSCDRCESS